MPDPTVHEMDTASGHRGWTKEQWKALSEVVEVGELCSLLQADQRRRWRNQQPFLTETYLEAFPALRADDRGVMDLLFHEFCVRGEFGSPGRLDEYRERFPQFIAALVKRLTVHQTLEGEAAKNPEPAPAPVQQSGNWDDDFPIIPRYDILRELGRGGMGVVYLASQEGLDRFVALKMILPGAQASAEDLQQFRVEAAAISRMQHPNLVQIYEVGEYQGLPYLTLEFVDGGNLDDHLEGRKMPPREAARMLVTLARAIHCAHQHGIVHRDLKPGNILLTSQGVPKISDFGVAKRVDRGGKPKNEGILGTPCYMAPEQARGKMDEIGPHTDVYALGGMLYKFLTDCPPFLGETVNDTMIMVMTREPDPPTLLQPGIPRALEEICMKCLQKDITKRYASAEALAGDLDRFLAQGKDDLHVGGFTGWLSRWIKG